MEDFLYHVRLPKSNMEAFLHHLLRLPKSTMEAAPIPVLPAQIDTKVQRIENRNVADPDLATPDTLGL